MPTLDSYSSIRQMNSEQMAISREHCQLLIEAYEVAYPRECCGFLLGTPGRRPSVKRVVTVLNAFSGLCAFAIPDFEVRRVKTMALKAGLSITAMFHSHPGGSPGLSDDDSAALRYSEWPWLLFTMKSATRELQFQWYQSVKRRTLSRRQRYEWKSER
jgi:proteasome lid subunit RPN8/RPN11